MYELVSYKTQRTATEGAGTTPGR
ncbi:hypothetical protein RHRU231_420126 [Rhodococcus ruber]|uniref:Uncharacterized protein n=1 Tax=Rhodococcus ruber TaxID=1830 RepID=A0A098BK54_9NOCA|nr:hypothetical protein RHRU231_420126 [Rhodococcus ruber]